MSGTMWATCVLNAALILLLSPLYEGIMRKLRATIHSRIGPPIIQPYFDILKLLGKEDLRAARSWISSIAPALALASVLVLAMLIPIGAKPPLGFAGDIVVLVYVGAMSAVLVMLVGFSSGSPYAFVGSAREMMLLLSVEPVLVVAFVVGAFKSGTMATGSIMEWNYQNGPTMSLTIAGIVFLLALQPQAGKLPFDIAEADQEIMGGPCIEQSGPRLALLKWTMWAKQLAFAFLFVELFVPWPRTGTFFIDLVLAIVKVLVTLIIVALIDVVNPRVRIDQAMRYFVRVAFASLAALAFAVIGM